MGPGLAPLLKQEILQAAANSSLVRRSRDRPDHFGLRAWGCRSPRAGFAAAGAAPGDPIRGPGAGHGVGSRRLALGRHGLRMDPGPLGVPAARRSVGRLESVPRPRGRGSGHRPDGRCSKAKLSVAEAALWRGRLWSESPHSDPECLRARQVHGSGPGEGGPLWRAGGHVEHRSCARGASANREGAVPGAIWSPVAEARGDVRGVFFRWP
jgi:hypothetical protein